MLIKLSHLNNNIAQNFIKNILKSNSYLFLAIDEWVRVDDIFENSAFSDDFDAKELGSSPWVKTYQDIWNSFLTTYY